MVRTLISNGGRAARAGLRAGLSAALFAVIVLAACGPGGPSPVPSAPLDSGIRGFVRLGPTCPVETRDVPCTTPYVAVLVILDADDREVARVTSGEDGRFEVLLPPGEYTIAPTPGGDPLPSAPPQSVSVVAGSFTEIEINYDTGIRGAE